MIVELFENQSEAETDVSAQIQLLLNSLGKRVASPVKVNLPEDLTVKQPLVLRAKYRQFVVD